MNSKKDISQKELIDREIEDCFDSANSISSQDCTGSVVRGPKSEGVANAYDEVYHYKPLVPDSIKRK